MTALTVTARAIAARYDGSPGKIARAAAERAKSKHRDLVTTGEVGRGRAGNGAQ